MKSLVLTILLSLGLSLTNATVGQTGKMTIPTSEFKYGNDSVKCVEDLSLYRESYKQWKASNYTSPSVAHAYKYWKMVFANCPSASENIYVDGVKMLDYYISKTNDPKRKQILIDSMMLVYDTRIELFPLHYQTGEPQKGAILARKGVDLYQLDPSAYLQVYDILKESIELDKAQTAAPVYVYYFRAATKMAQKGELDTATVVDSYDQITEYIEINLKNAKAVNNEGEIAVYESIQGNIENTFEPFATCRDLVKIYKVKFDKTPNDVELLKKITKILDKRRCQEEPLYFDATVNLYKLEPTPESAYLIGKLYLKQQRYTEAIPYMENATKMDDQEKVDDAYIFLAQTYKALNNLPKARSMALKAIETNPNWGEPYMFIGDLYAISANDCGDNDLTKKVAYWAAVDKYYKSKQVDPELTEEADKRIRTYSVYFPPTEVLFFYNLNEGDSYTVNCWINENTTVRAAK
ncbi:MAG TPA: tetratricopeptide repeat protein [Bacteroidales bacterium]